MTKTTWLTPYLEVWAEAAGTAVAVLPAARSAKIFKALETAYGADDVLRRWKTAWATTPPFQQKFLTPESFARRYGEFTPVEVDDFGFAIVSTGQAEWATLLYETVIGITGAESQLRERLKVPSTFPRSAAIYAGYELLRRHHENAMHRYPSVRSDASRIASLTQAMSATP